MKLVYRRGLPALCSAVLVAGVLGVGTPALAAGEPPTGTFTLNANSLWSGQQVTLTQTALADDTPDAVISRVIAWGDGSSTTAAADETKWTHTYSGPGTFPVSVALNDGDTPGQGTIASPSVKVTNATGSLGWQKSTIYTAPIPGTSETYAVEGIFTPKGLPTSEGTRAWTTWNDGEFSLLKEQAASTTVPHYYSGGTHTPSVQYENANGKATPRTASPLKVAVDVTPPTTSFTFPANAGRGSSWKALKGTARDSQAGIDVAMVVAIKYNTAADYYYNFETKKWVKITDPGAYLPDAAGGMSKVNSAGVWSVPITGVTKGYHLWLQYWAYDNVGNQTKIKEASAFISS